MDTGAKRPAFLTLMAVLFTVLALSNATKSLQSLSSPHLGVVVFGFRFEGFWPNVFVGPLLALMPGAYALGLFRLRAWVWPLAAAYAFYVPTNLVLFWSQQTGAERPAVSGVLIYLVFALGGSIGTALYLARRKEALLR
jgi:hypothetical protein